MIISLVFYVAFVDLILCSKSTNCPKNNIQFEKILGFEPSSHIKGYLLYQDKDHYPVTVQCISKCLANEECRSFVLYYETSSCFWLKDDYEGTEEKYGVSNPEAAWFVKKCLDLGSRSCQNLWVVERIPGATLIGNDTKLLDKVETESECEQHCLSESKFVCRSAKFKSSNSEHNGETDGSCTLSNADRHSLPNAYRVSSFDDDYIENQCVNETRTPGVFCSYEEYENVTLANKDVLYTNTTKEQCQSLCEKYAEFNCRGFSITRTGKKYDCYLHSEDSKVHGPRLLIKSPYSFYYERATCLDISVLCSSTHLIVLYKPDADFNGKIYLQGYSDRSECFAKGVKQNAVTLKVPLQVGQCGLTKAGSPNDRSLISGNMILQYNAYIQTQADRLIRVGCIFSKGNGSKVVVGTGISITNSYPNQGGELVNSTGTGSSSLPSPKVEMRVVDFQTHAEVTDTEIGQELELIVEIKDVKGSIDLWASHLVAMTGNNEDSILLLDERGCPTNLKVFPAMSKVYTNTTRMLFANFQAFKFTASPVVRFSVIVQFCPTRCPPINCGSGIESYGRRKRDLTARSVDISDGTNVEAINRTEFENSRPVIRTPLQFSMVVRDPKLNPDRLIYSDPNKDKILVAGYDLVNDQVCVDFSLFIGLIITWILVQIVIAVCSIFIIRRYKRYYSDSYNQQSLEELHKNFGIGFSNLENRRVHWADNGDYN